MTGVQTCALPISLTPVIEIVGFLGAKKDQVAGLVIVIGSVVVYPDERTAIRFQPSLSHDNKLLYQEEPHSHQDNQFERNLR